jgi:drug/metabolite transporter (DMT)-like permease
MNSHQRLPERSPVLVVAAVLLICGIAGGSNFVLIKSLVSTITPMQLVAGRVVLAGITLSFVLLASRRMPRLSRATLRDAGILAIIDTVIPYLLLALAAPHILASTSGLLIATMPLFTALVVAVTDRTPLRKSTAVGLVLGAVGVSVLAGPAALDFGSSAWTSMIAVLIASFSYAASAVYSRIPLRSVNPIELSAIKFVIAGLVLVPLIVASGETAGYSRLDLSGWLALLIIGFVVTGLARCGYVWVIEEAGSVSASLLTYIIPVATLAIAWVYLDETLSLSEWLGALLVGASTICMLSGPSVVRALKRFWPVSSPQTAIDTSQG